MYKSLAILFILIILISGASLAFILNDKTKIIVDAGYFKYNFSSLSIKERYEYYTNLGANQWSSKFNSCHTITINFGERSLGTGIIGEAAPTSYNDSNLVLEGLININYSVWATLSESERIFTIKHELGHILGIGDTNNTSNPKVWETDINDLLVGSTYTNTLNGYTGLDASTSELTNIPAENTGSSGTKSVHWENNDRNGYQGMPNELMIGTIGGLGLISSVSLGFLKDLGFDINLNSYDEGFVLGSSSLQRSFIFDLEGNEEKEFKKKIKIN